MSNDIQDLLNRAAKAKQDNYPKLEAFYVQLAELTKLVEEMHAEAFPVNPKNLN